MIIRDERTGDEAGIRALTRDAFAGHSHSDGSEPDIIDRLRTAGMLTLSLVAEKDGEIIAHLAMSPVSIEDGTADWYGLGPLSVRPGEQLKGNGSRLVREALRRLEQRAAGGCVVAGDPDYYGRFGFAHTDVLELPGMPPQYFQALVLHGGMPSGIVSYHAAFGGDAA